MGQTTRTPNVNTMVRYFLQNFDIPTRKDLKKINAKLNRLEKLVAKNGRHNPTQRRANARSSRFAWQQVLDVIPYKDGVGIAEICERTGFEATKVRNIVFRLSNESKIKRVSRGVYISI